MATSVLAIPKVLKYEGVYDNDPKDPGGETVFGITRKYQPGWHGWARVDELKLVSGFPKWLKDDPEIKQAVFDYYNATWEKMKLEKVDHQDLAECVYNGAINQGPERTGKWLQYCINALSPASEDISEDGAIGDGTVSRINELVCEGKGDLLLDLLKAQRIAAYTVTVHNREDSLKFIKGWLARINQGG